jgi:hypothetical protein
MILPKGGSVRLFIHPAALLAALIATALTHATAWDSIAVDPIDAATSATESGSSRLPSLGSLPHAGTESHPSEVLRPSPLGTDSVQSPARADAPAYSPSLIATAVATAVISLSIIGDDQFSQVAKEFLQAITSTVPPPSQAEVRAALGDQVDPRSTIAHTVDMDAAEDAAQLTSFLRSALPEALDAAGEAPAAPVDLVRGDASSKLDSTPALPVLAHLAPLDVRPQGSGGDWRNLSQAPGVDPDSYDIWLGTAPELKTAASGSPTLTRSQAAATELLGTSTVTEGQGQVHGTSVIAQADKAASHPLGHTSALVEISHFSFFREGAEFLGVFRFDDLKTSDARDNGTGTGQSTSPLPLEQSATWSLVAAATSDDLPLPSGVISIPYEASPETKALVLSDFAYSHAHEVFVSPEALATVRGKIAANIYMPDVDRVIIFDVPHTNADVFMLMPGVAMVRSDPGYLGFSQAPVQPIDFVLSDGATLRLLGMIDI